MQVEQHSSGIDAGTQDLAYDLPSAATDSPRARRTLVKGPAETFSYDVLKRLFDIAVVLLLSPFVLPVVAVLFLAVVLSSPGPAFFSHRRIRQGGSFFSMWKFRTMCVNSAELLEQHLTRYPAERAEWLRTHKLRNDPRVTPLGNLLRKSSLDELPQVWNVITGRMSLVGPRPIVAAEAEKYGDQFPFYLAVKPGITGLWQTSGRSTLTYDERVALDRHYVEHWSIWLDIKILFRTVGKVANSDGAY